MAWQALQGCPCLLPWPPREPPRAMPWRGRSSASPQPCGTLTHSAEGNTGHSAGDTGRPLPPALPMGPFSTAPSASSWSWIGFWGSSLPWRPVFLFLHLDAYRNPILTAGSLLLPPPRTNTDEPPSHAFCLLNLFSTSLSTITYLARGLKSKLQLRLSEGPSRA